MAFGRVDSVNERAAGRTVMLSGPVVVSTGLLESIALTIRFAVPATVGVPLTTHPEIESPEGSVPTVTTQEYGDVPPPPLSFFSQQKEGAKKQFKLDLWTALDPQNHQLLSKYGVFKFMVEFFGS